MRNQLTIALGATATFVLGGALYPLFNLMPIAAARGVLLAPVYSFCLYTVLARVGTKPSSATVLFGMLLGFLLLIFMPYLLPVTAVAAVLASVLPTRTVKAAAFSALQFPLMYLMTMPFPRTPGALALLAGLTALGLGLGLGGALLARRVGRRWAPDRA